MAPRATNTRNDSAQQPKSVKVWFPVYVGDFFTVTSDMTGHEVGAYQLILAKLWREGGAIPANDRQLAKLVKATPRQWKDIKDTLWPLFEIRNGMLTHAETLAEIEKAKANVEQKSRAGKASAAQRALNNRATGVQPRAGEGEGAGSSDWIGASKEDDGDGPFLIVTGGRND